MMKNPEGGVALAVRQPDGTIKTEYSVKKSRAQKGTFLGLPIVRGAVVFVESLIGGMETITRSAELYGDEDLLKDEEPSRFEKWLAEKLGKSAMDIAMVIAVILALALSVGLFFFLPTLLSGLFFKLIPNGAEAPSILKNLFEGIVRLMIFIGYILAVSAMKDIRRVFMYHGAEHKTIACYEHDAELTPENAMRYSRLHARCGTNYLFLVMAVSILFFACLPYSNNFLLRFLTRLLFIPLVAGISYEILKLAASSDHLLARVVRAPGLALQKLTTREPDRDMLEVAIKAFKLAMRWEEPSVSKETVSDPKAAKQEPAQEENGNADATQESDNSRNTEPGAADTTHANG